MLTVRLAESKADVGACLRLRWTVFVEEQGVPPSLEVDEHDAADAVHAIAAWKGVPCGAGRFVLGGGVAKIGRLAVVDDARGRGAGTALLRFLEEEARRRGARELMLWSQVSARAFYERFGYTARGGEFDDAGIRHVEMWKPAR
jgi:predicted GNAT family N-acyltransferase